MLAFSDTDSIVYVSKPSGQDEPPTGQTLSLLANELKPGEFIWRFQVLAPKNYWFECRHESDPLRETVRMEMKCKGQLLTTNVKSSFDWDIYEVLIEQRLEPLTNFYKKLKSMPLQSTELTANALEKFNVGGTGLGPALVLPCPTLQRNNLTARIFEDLKRTRPMCLMFDKIK